MYNQVQMHHARNMRESHININMSTEEKEILKGVVLNGIDEQQHRIRQCECEIKHLLYLIDEANTEIKRLNLWLEKIDKNN